MSCLQPYRERDMGLLDPLSDIISEVIIPKMNHKQFRLVARMSLINLQ